MGKLESYYRKIALKFIVVYFLNIMDFLFTKQLIETGYFLEANPVIAPIIDEDIVMVGVKIILVAVLCIFMLIRLKKANLKQLRISNWVMNGAVAFYSVVNMSHLFWTLQVM